MAEKLLYVINSAAFFVSHRFPVACAAAEKGYEVHVSSPYGPGVEKILEEGFIYHKTDITRSGINPVRELSAVYSLYRLFRQVRPDILHLVTVKPVLYGSIAANLTGIRGVVAAVPGLGSVFSEKGASNYLLRKIISLLYKIAFCRKNLHVIFQNSDDLKIISAICRLSEENVTIIPGSGVDLEKYPFKGEEQGIPVVSMASRLLRDKGVPEFIEAARILSERKTAAEFRLIGSPDPGNPGTVTEEELEKWEKEGFVKILGYRNDIPQLFASSSIIAHPSSYREGLPKVLVEAAACGRAVVTTDTPGCRDAVIPGETALLVPVRDPVALADAVEFLIKNPGIRKKMGKDGRSLAERDFSIKKIVESHMNIYEKFSCMKSD